MSIDPQNADVATRLDDPGYRSQGNAVVAPNHEGKTISAADTFRHFYEFVTDGHDWLQTLELWVAKRRSLSRRNRQVPFINDGVAKLAKPLT